MFKTILIVVVILIAAILVYAATMPDDFRVQRMTSIKASPEKIFALINDLHRWNSWSPWEKMDPAMQRTFSGATAGKGAVYAWQGNSKVGEGRMEIADASPPSRVMIKLDFIKPIAKAIPRTSPGACMAPAPTLRRSSAYSPAWTR
jgi:hypothetical protein